VIGDKAALVLGDQQLVANSVGERGLPLRIGRASGSLKDATRSEITPIATPADESATSRHRLS
jgi:hypothetical protein